VFFFFGGSEEGIGGFCVVVVVVFGVSFLVKGIIIMRVIVS